MSKISNFILRVEGLEKTFKQAGNSLTVFKDLSLQVAEGEIVALVGQSGSGKSTLLQLAGLLDTPSSGSVWIDNQPVSTLPEKKRTAMRSHDIGFIYQFHHLLPEFNALENVSMPLLIGGASPASAKEMSRDILIKVGLGGRLSHRIGELSGGERQRCAIARALVTKPNCVLADEPTGNLDTINTEEIIQILKKINEFGTTVVLVTHNREVVNHLRRRVITLEDGEVVNDETTGKYKL